MSDDVPTPKEAAKDIFFSSSIKLEDAVKAMREQREAGRREGAEKTQEENKKLRDACDQLLEAYALAECPLCESRIVQVGSRNECSAECPWTLLERVLDGVR